MEGDDALSPALAALAESVRVQQEKLAQQSQQIAQLQIQAQQQENQIRQIPLIPKLIKAENSHTWRASLIEMLDRYQLTKYIDKDVPEPEDPRARRGWQIDRLDVNDYIQATVSDRGFWEAARVQGAWSATDINPKKTFDLVMSWCTGIASPEWCILASQEIFDHRCEEFGSLAAFQARVIYLKEYLEKSDFGMPEKGYIWLVLKGIALKYPDIYTRCVARIETMTWGLLMDELRAQTNKESNSRKRPRGK